MYQRILVPIDGSSTSQRGLREAISLAKLTGGRLRLMHVIDQLSTARARSAYEGYSANWLADARREANTLLEEAAALTRAEGIETDTLLHDSYTPHLAEVVVEEANRWQADLIVLGTHGRRGVGRFLMGSGAESIMRFAQQPVLLVRAAEQVKARDDDAVKISLPAGALALE